MDIREILNAHLIFIPKQRQKGESCRPPISWVCVCAQVTSQLCAMLLIQRLPSQCPHGMFWALIWVVGSALSLAYAQVTTEYACPTETVRPKKAIHAYCPEVTPKYSADNTSFTFPVEVVAGCPFLLSLNSGEQAFFKVQRPRPGMRISHNVRTQWGHCSRAPTSNENYPTSSEALM